MAHDQIGLLESLLASIFRPRYSYCIFVDVKSSIKFKNQVKKLIRCYKQKFPKVNNITTAGFLEILMNSVLNQKHQKHCSSVTGWPEKCYP